MPSTGPGAEIDSHLKRFGQGAEVDRGRPHIFHRDYWALRAVRDGVAVFFSANASELSGKRILDYGAGHSPYAALAHSVGAQIVCADIGDPPPGAVRISRDGRIDLPDNCVNA